MKRLFWLFASIVISCGTMFAGIDRYKTDMDYDNTINHVTYELPLYYGKDRTNLMGVYTLATNVGGKQSGTLSFDFKETENAFSTQLRNAVLRISKDLRESDFSRIMISFTLSNGEEFIFDGSYFSDWRREEWNELIHVSYNSETNVYRSYIMFPLEYLKSSQKSLSGKVEKRYEYMLKALGKYNITKISIMNESRAVNVKIDIPISRPTAETMHDMINNKIKTTKTKAAKTPKAKKEKKHTVENGRKVNSRR